MPNIIVPIVEGHGEVAAVPLLLRRIAHELHNFQIEVRKPIRVPKQKLLKPGELERALDLAAQKGDGPRGIFVLLDADQDCPRLLGPELLARAMIGREGTHIQVVLAKTEYEAWFLGAINSLLPDNQNALGVFNPQGAETVQGAKEKLAELLGIFYSETVDQPAYSTKFDLAEARVNCPSFDKLCRAIRLLLEAD